MGTKTIQARRSKSFPPETLVALLRDRAEQTPRETAFLFLNDGEQEDAPLTYAELDRRARAVASLLQSLGLEGGRALLLYPAGLDFIAAFFGCLYAGVVAVPAYPPRLNRSLNRIQAIAADADAEVALTTRAVWERVQPVLDQTPDLMAVRWLPTDATPRGIEDEWQEPDVDARSLAFLQYTSGSTGTPKGVILTHGNLLHNCSLIARGFARGADGTGVFWLPSYHDMGLIGGILQPLYFGRPNILMPPVAFLQRPIRWLRAISKYGATISGGPNFAYDLCVHKTTAEQRAELDLSRWAVAFNGAEPIRAESLDRFVAAFAPYGFRREAFYPCYGLAEATLLVSGGAGVFADPIVADFDARALEEGRALALVDDVNSEAGRRLVSSGAGMPDQQIKIVHPESLTSAADGEVGEIWVRGPSIAQGYWQRIEESARTFRACLADGEGPFLRTGDLGFLRDGELFVTGRLKDVMIVHGRNHYPQDIELTVETCHAAIRPGCGAAFTVDDESDSRLIVVYEIERSQRHETASVFEAIRRAIAREHELTVAAIVLVKPGSVPKTSSGKIQRHACRFAFVEETLNALARWSAADEPTGVPRPALPRRVSAAVRQTSANGGVQRIVYGPAQSTPPEPAELRSSRDAAPRSADAVVDEVRRVAQDRAGDLSLDTNLLDLGLDSLERMEIIAALENRFGGRLPEEVMIDLETCRQVAEAVDRHLGSDSGGRPASAGRAAPLSGSPQLSDYEISRFPEYLALRQKLDMLAASGLGDPYFNVHESVARDTTVIGGRGLIHFCSYNYLGLSGDPRVDAAAKDAIDRYGTSVSASRLVSGERPVHVQLERAIADLVGVESSIVFVGGHATNESTIGHLMGPGDLVLHDALAHNSIIQGAILSGARRRPFPHNDWRALDRLLDEVRNQHRRVLIVIEGVYSMDGDIADLPRFIDVKRKHKTLLMVDEAHSMGVLGRSGRGVGEHFDVNPADVDLWMGTLSKSFASCGGYIAGSRALVEYLKFTAPGFVYSVGLPPASAAAALEAIRILTNEPERVARLADNGRLFLRLARQRGLNTGASLDSPVVPVILGNSLDCLRLSRALFRGGVNVQPIVHPAVEENAARLRFFVTAAHQESQIRQTVDLLAAELRRINPGYLAAERSLESAAH